MKTFFAEAALAAMILAAAGCSGDDDGAAPDAAGPADAGPDGGGLTPDAARPDAAPADAGPPPPLAHPPRLAFLSAGVPYLVEWLDGVPQAPVALTDGSVPVGSLSWSPDGRVLLLEGTDLSAIGFDESGPMPMQTLPIECATDCWVDDFGWSPDGRHLWLKLSADPAQPSSDPPHYLEVVDVAEDGSFGVRQRISSDSYIGESYPLAVWSPDSTKLLWAFAVTDATAQLTLFTGFNGAGMPMGSVLSEDANAIWPTPMWCPDSRRILFSGSGAPARPDLSGLLRADLSSATPVLTELDASLQGAFWEAAQDCHMATFTSNVDGHSYAVDSDAAAPSAPVAFDAAAGYWSPDSRWVMGSAPQPGAPDASELIAYDTTLGTPGPTTDLGIAAGPVIWREDSQQLAVSVTTAPQLSTTYLVDVSGAAFSAARPISFPPSTLNVGIVPHAWSSDGHWLVYSGKVAGHAVVGVVDASSATPGATEIGPVAVAGRPWAPGAELLAFRTLPADPATARLQVLDLSTPDADPVAIDDGHLAAAWAWQP